MKPSLKARNGLAAVRSLVGDSVWRPGCPARTMPLSGYGLDLYCVWRGVITVAEMAGSGLSGKQAVAPDGQTQIAVPHFDERQHRLAIGADSRPLGHNGVILVTRAGPRLRPALPVLVEPNERGEPYRYSLNYEVEPTPGSGAAPAWLLRHRRRDWQHAAGGVCSATTRPRTTSKSNQRLGSGKPSAGSTRRSRRS